MGELSHTNYFDPRKTLFKINLLTYKTLCEKQPVYLHTMLAVLLPSRSLRTNKDQSVSPYCRDQHGCKSFSFLCTITLEEPPAVCPFNHFNCYLQETSEDTSLWFGISPTGNGIDVRNCFLDFAVEHWFGCRATVPGFKGNIGAIEIWLINIRVKIFSILEKLNTGTGGRFLLFRNVQ